DDVERGDEVEAALGQAGLLQQGAAHVEAPGRARGGGLGHRLHTHRRPAAGCGGHEGVAGAAADVEHPPGRLAEGGLGHRHAPVPAVDQEALERGVERVGGTEVGPVGEVAVHVDGVGVGVLGGVDEPAGGAATQLVGAHPERLAAGAAAPGAALDRQDRQRAGGVGRHGASPSAAGATTMPSGPASAPGSAPPPTTGAAASGVAGAAAWLEREKRVLIRSAGCSTTRWMATVMARASALATATRTTLRPSPGTARSTATNTGTCTR